MQYKYRWWYAIIAGFITLISGFFYEILPEIIQIFQLNETKIQLKEKLGRLKIESNVSKMAQPHEVVPISNQKFSLSDLFLSAHLSDISIQSLEKKEDDRGMEDVPMHIIAQGRYEKIHAWLKALARPNYPIVISNFVYKVDHDDQCIFSADIFIFKNNYFKVSAHDQDGNRKSYNPFCLPQTSSLRSALSDVEKLQQSSLSQMKMVGYLADANKNQALLLLPDSSVIAVSKGFLLGKEQGIISEIEPNRVVIFLQNNKQYVIAD